MIATKKEINKMAYFIFSFVFLSLVGYYNHNRLDILTSSTTA